MMDVLRSLIFFFFISTLASPSILICVGAIQ